MSEKIDKIHDKFFWEIYGRPENCRAFLKDFLPVEIYNQLDLSVLDVARKSYLDEKFKDHFSDLVIKTNFKDGESVFLYFLMEHKSTVELLVALQLLRYMTVQWNELEKQELLKAGKLPPIIPIVIYQGEARWTAKVGFQDLVYIPFEGLRTYIPNFQYFLDDVSNVDVEKFKESIIIKCWHVICKYLRTPELRVKLPEIVSLLFDFLEKDKATEYLDIFFKYLANATDVIKKEDVEESLRKLPQGGEDIMRTWADEFRDEGIVIGEKRGEKREERREERRFTDFTLYALRIY